MTLRVGPTDDLSSCLSIRAAVFTDEQGISSEEDQDGLDDTAIQFLLTHADEPIGTARMLIDDTVGKIGRVAVLKSHRGAGHGKRLIEAAIAKATALGLARVKLGAQVDAIGFYSALGFSPVGDVFDDAGIPHQMMVRDL